MSDLAHEAVLTLSVAFLAEIPVSLVNLWIQHANVKRLPLIKGTNVAWCYHLLYFLLPQKKEETENIAYTLKEINAFGGQSLYNAVAICSPEILADVRNAWDKAFENSEILFVCNQTQKKKGL